MKKMKKLLFMVVFATAATVFVGCGNKEDNSGDTALTAQNRRHKMERIKKT